MKKKTYFTKESFEEAKKNLDFLQTQERKKIAKQFKEAQDNGDISDSAEFTAAQHAQNLLDIRIAELQEKIAHAKIIDESRINTSCVSILTTVKVKNKRTGMEASYKLVPPAEADIKQGKLSTTSPIAKGLLHKKRGEIAIVNVPAGKLELEILDITL